MKKALVILAILVAALSAWILAFPNKNPFAKWFSKTSGSTGTSEVKGHVDVSSNFNPVEVVQDADGFPLKQGSQNYYVAEVQRGLNDFWNADLVVDGIFGPKTYSRLQALGFNADGITREEYVKIINGLT